MCDHRRAALNSRDETGGNASTKLKLVRGCENVTLLMALVINSFFENSYDFNLFILQDAPLP